MATSKCVSVNIELLIQSAAADGGGLISWLDRETGEIIQRGEGDVMEDCKRFIEIDPGVFDDPASLHKFVHSGWTDDTAKVQAALKLYLDCGGRYRRFKDQADAETRAAFYAFDGAAKDEAARAWLRERGIDCA